MPFDKSAAAGAPQALPDGFLDNYRASLFDGLEESDIDDLVYQNSGLSAEEIGMKSTADKETDRQEWVFTQVPQLDEIVCCLLYTSPSPRDATLSRMPSSA